jgi:diguanylate cyclase (GGDEF)-like protein
MATTRQQRQAPPTGRRTGRRLVLTLLVLVGCAWLTTLVMLLVQLSCLTAVLAAALAARRSTGRLRAAWILIALAVGAWSAARAGSWQFAATAATLAATVGVCTLTSRTGGVIVRDLVDALILALGLVAIWPTVMPRFSSLEAGHHPGGFGHADLLADIALLCLAALATARTARRMGPELLAGTGAGALAVTDIAMHLLTPQPATIQTAALVWSGGIALLAVAAWRLPQPADQSDQLEQAAGVDGGQHSAWGSMYALPYAPLAAALVVAIVQWLHGTTLTSTTILLLLAASITLRENRRLAEAVAEGRLTLRQQALQDPVTGLGNRALFTRQLCQAMARRAETEQALAVLLCDVDAFKSVNDGMGQAFGDRVLAEVAARLRRALPESTALARLGGDEFAVLIEQLDPVEAAASAGAIGRHLQGELAADCTIDGVQVSLGVSVGMALVWPGQQPVAADEVLSRADIAMHTAKRAVRRNPVIHTDGLALPDAQDWWVRPAFESALRSGAVVPHYQPLIDLGTSRPMAFEALARWSDGGRLTQPGVFLPVAARAGLLPELMAQILRAAARDLAHWRQDPRQAHLRVAVNISPSQILDPAFPALTRQVLKQTGLAPDGLVLEITEESVLDDLDGAAQVVTSLAELGVRVWLDDFGAGYSSLSLLHRLPLEAVKLDKCLVQTIDDDPHLRRLVGGLIALSHDLGLDVIAEGIQRSGQAEVLRQLGCSLGQGFLFGPAVPQPEARALLRRPSLHSAAPTLVPAARRATPGR